MQEPMRPRRKKPNVQEHRDPAIIEEERLRLLELQRLLRSKISELPGPRVFGLEDPQTRGWLETPSGLGQLKPQDLDRVLLMLETLDLLFIDLIGGANPNENWRSTLLSNTIEALRLELEKPRNGKYPDAFNPNNFTPPATLIRLQIRAEAVRAVHYFVPFSGSKITKARARVATLLRRHTGKGSLASLKRWERDFNASRQSYFSKSLFISSLPDGLKWPVYVSSGDQQLIEECFERAISMLENQARRENSNEKRMQTTSRRRSRID